jgi:hypothetical protein
MPHLLMSNDEPETAAAPAQAGPSDSSPEESTPADSSPTVLQFRRIGHSPHPIVRPRQLRGTDPGLEPLRRQSSSIIAEVLADTNPDQAAVRDKLRWHVANNPGQPEKALLDHLMTVAVEQEESA